MESAAGCHPVTISAADRWMAEMREMLRSVGCAAAGENASVDGRSARSRLGSIGLRYQYRSESSRDLFQATVVLVRVVTIASMASAFVPASEVVVAA